MRVGCDSIVMLQCGVTRNRAMHESHWSPTQQLSSYYVAVQLHAAELAAIVPGFTAAIGLTEVHSKTEYLYCRFYCCRNLFLFQGLTGVHSKTECVYCGFYCRKNLFLCLNHKQMT